MTEETKDDKTEEEEQSLMIIPDLSVEPSIRMLNVYGEINEDRSRGTVSALNLLKLTGQTETEDEEDEEAEPEVSYEPIEFFISTEGGNVQDMFSIYDCMRFIQQDCEIHTVGLGKVMSAGILLLAAGTKGKRKVGKYCRLMIHSIQGGQFGSIKELETDIREVRWYQEQFINAIANETKLDRKELKSIFRRKTDTYFDAEQALEWGIADEIV
jgi:ATP-dependent Clp endopeptidase proteolytic subunit ClpP